MQNDDLIQVLKAIAHPARLAILGLLRSEEQCVCHIEAALGQRQAYISQHLMTLRQAGLVEDRRDGSRIYYRVVRPEIFALLDSAAAMTGEAGAGRVAGRIEGCPCPKCSGEWGKT